MAFGVLVDNWTLQDAGHLLEQGFADDTAVEICFAADGLTYNYRDIPIGGVQVEALFQLINHIVFADEMVVDADNTGAWDKIEALAPLCEPSLIARTPFRRDLASWKDAREAIERILCFCPEVARVHQENKLGFAHGQQPDRMLGQLVWGGAGMLARAQAASLPYSSHPLRDRLFRHARLLAPANAEATLQNFIEAQRARIYLHAPDGGQAAVYTQLVLPPAVIETIDLADGVSGIIPAALEVRKRRGEIRTWIREYQSALMQENIREISAHKRQLNKLGRHFDSLVGARISDSPSLELSCSFTGPEVSIAQPLGAAVNWLRMSIGTCATLRKFIEQPSGKASLRKLYRLFEIEGSVVASSVTQSLVARSDA